MTSAQKRAIPAGLFLAFLTIYVEWAKQKQFVFEMEYELLANSMSHLGDFAVPIVFVPFLFQLLLVVAAFQKHPNRILILLAVVFLLFYVLLVLWSGLFGGVWKMTLSTIPFLAISTLFFINFRRYKKPDATTVN